MTDHELEIDIERELGREARIGVSTEGGVIMLSGYVATEAEKAAAERAATRVPGVVAIANELVVTVPLETLPCDAEIADRCELALRERHFDVRVVVHRRWVTLEGALSPDHKRRAAELAVKDLRGVVGVTNNIVLGAAKLAE